MVKNPPANAGAVGEEGLIPGSKIPWCRKCQPTAVFLPEISHGQRILMGYNPQGQKELDTTEVLK